MSARTRSVFVLLAVILTACENPVEPTALTLDEAQREIILPPFPNQEILLTVGGSGHQTLSFYAPAGIDPLLDVEVAGGFVQINHEYLYKSDELPCPGDCRVVWRYGIDVTGLSLGVSTVSLMVRKNRQMKSTFRVVVGTGYTKG